MTGCGECKYCHKRVFEHLEIVTQICSDCYAESKEIEEECEALWQDYMDEKFETREANQ